MGFVSGLGQAAKGFANVAGDALDGAKEVVKDGIDDARDVKKSVEKGVEEFAGDVKKGVSKSAESIKDSAEDVWETAGDIEDCGIDFMKDAISDGLKFGVRVHDEIEGAAEDAITKGKKGLGVAKERAKVFGRDVKKEAKDTVEDLDARATKFGRGVKQGALESFGRMDAKADAAIALADKAATHVEQAVRNDTQLVLDIVEQLKTTSVEELMDAGWEAAGFSESDRDLLKQVVSAKVDKTSDVVQAAAQALLDAGKEVTIENLKLSADILLGPVGGTIVQGVLHEGGMEELINEKVNVLEMGAIELSEFVTRNKEVFEPSARMAGEIAQLIDESQQSPVRDLARLASPALFTLLDREATKLSSILKVGAQMPEVAEAIAKNPEEFSEAMDLLKPGHMVKSIENLKPGESFTMSMGAGLNGNALDAKVGGEIKVEMLEKGIVKMTIKQNMSLGQSFGGKEAIDSGYAVGTGVELVLEMPAGVASESITQLIQLNVHQLEDFDESKFERIKVKNLSIPTEAELTAELKSNFDVSVEGKVKFTAAKEIAREDDGSTSQVGKASIQWEAGVGIKTDPLKLSLPDGVSVGRPASIMNSLLELAPDKDRAALSELLNHNDSGMSAKASVGLDFEAKFKADGNFTGAVSAKIQLDATPNAVEAQVKLELKDGNALAKALGRPAQNLGEAIKAGDINLVELLKSHPDLMPNIINIELQVDLTGYDNVGGELSTSVGGAKLEQKHAVKKALYKSGDAKLGELDAARIKDTFVEVNKERQLLRRDDPPKLKPKPSTVMDMIMGGFIRG